MAKDSPEIIYRALGKLLAPLVRFCLRHSLKFQDLHELMKRTFVEVAEQEMLRQSAEISVSRIAAITGLQRREVSNLRSLSIDEPSPSNIVSRVVAQWRHDPRFQTSGRQPRVLSMGTKQSEFSELIQSVNKDLNPYTVLFELERLGYVEHRPNGLRLNARLHGTAVNPAESLALLAADVRDLLEAVNQNIFNREPVPNLHLRTEYDNIPPEELPQIRAWLVREGTRFHELVSSYLAEFDRDMHPQKDQSPSKSKVVLGSFSWTEVFREPE